MPININNNYIALICEGKCEKYVVEKLLDDDLLIFDRNQLLDKKVLSGEFRNANKFSNKYLTLGYDKKIKVLLVVDKEVKLKIKKIFSHNIDDQICIITRPEIEMLMIMAMGQYNNYQKVKSKQKPSDYMKSLVGESVKNEKYVEKFYNQYDLVSAIKEYHKVRPNKLQYSLKDILNV